MSRPIDQQHLIATSEIAAAPIERACVDQTFELPGGLYVALGGMFFAFLAIMTIGFASPALAVPMGINFAFLTAFFAVPAIFVGASHGGAPALRWSEFLRKGVNTANGHSSAGEATVLVLTLPFLILCWAVAIVVIAKLV
jgi:hypothetical protein